MRVYDTLNFDSSQVECLVMLVVGFYPVFIYLMFFFLPLFFLLFLTLFFPRHQEMPYVMVRSERNLTGNDRYEGFCIDLLKAIAGSRVFILFFKRQKSKSDTILTSIYLYRIG